MESTNPLKFKFWSDYVLNEDKTRIEEFIITDNDSENNFNLTVDELGHGKETEKISKYVAIWDESFKDSTEVEKFLKKINLDNLTDDTTFIYQVGLNKTGHYAYVIAELKVPNANNGNFTWSELSKCLFNSENNKIDSRLFQLRGNFLTEISKRDNENTLKYLASFFFPDPKIINVGEIKKLKSNQIGILENLFGINPNDQAIYEDDESDDNMFNVKKKVLTIGGEEIIIGTCASCGNSMPIRKNENKRICDECSDFV